MTLGQYALVAVVLACMVMAAFPYYLVMSKRRGDGNDE